MALVSFLEDDEYRPDYSAVVVRDTGLGLAAEEVLGPESARLSEQAAVGRTSSVTGSIARTGVGWLFAAATDSYQRVRLEAHDSAPEFFPDAPVDVVELPYFCVSGEVYLTTMTGADSDRRLLLGSPGLFRARIARRRLDDREFEWLLTFWPEPKLTAPRWWRRTTPAVGVGRPDWEEALARQAFMLFIVIAKADDAGFTLKEFEAQGAQHWGDGWLDRPFLEPVVPPPMPTGHADMDDQIARHVEAQRTDRQRRRDLITDVAAQLGLVEPETYRDLLAILVAGGAFVADGTPARYRQPADTPQARDVLTLPPDLIAALDKRDADQRYAHLAADLVCIAGWSLGQPMSLPELADRLDATVSAVQAAIGYAVAGGSLTTTPTALTDAGVSEHLTLAPVIIPPTAAARPPRAPRRPRPTPAEQPPRVRPSEIGTAPQRRAGTAAILVTVSSSRHRPSAPFTLPAGEPPRAGYIALDGSVIRMRDGIPHVVAKLGSNRCQQALETVAGIALFGGPQYGALARWNGAVTELAPDAIPFGVTNRDGTKLAFVLKSLGRQSRHTLRVMDLLDGGCIDMPSAQEFDARPAGFIDDTLYFFGRGGRWPLTGSPELTDFHPIDIDPFTNTILAADQEPGLVIVRPDGRQQRVKLSSGRLVPGGTHLWSFHAGALDLFDVTIGAASIRTIHFGADERQKPPLRHLRPVWEDQTHLLVTVGSPSHGGVVRIDIEAGTAEACANDGDDLPYIIPIQPLLTRT